MLRKQYRCQYSSAGIIGPMSTGIQVWEAGQWGDPEKTKFKTNPAWEAGTLKKKQMMTA
jgi:hypothetical protein